MSPLELLNSRVLLQLRKVPNSVLRVQKQALSSLERERGLFYRAILEAVAEGCLLSRPHWMEWRVKGSSGKRVAGRLASVKARRQERKVGVAGAALPNE